MLASARSDEAECIGSEGEIGSTWKTSSKAVTLDKEFQIVQTGNNSPRSKIGLEYGVVSRIIRNEPPANLSELFKNITVESQADLQQLNSTENTKPAADLTPILREPIFDQSGS